MSIILVSIATDSGVPIFTRKRGTVENIQFSTIASLHGVNMFAKCHNVSMKSTQLDNGTVLWKEFSKSITLIGVVTGGLDCDIAQLLSTVYDLMVFYVGMKELETMKNVEQIKRELVHCYPILDYLLESLDTNIVPHVHPTLTLDLIECILCPQAAQLQQALDNYAECVTGRWACLAVHGRLVATSTDFAELDVREAKLLLLLMMAQEGAPLRETPVYLPQMSPNVAFRAVTCKLLADVYILVICGATPALSQIDEIVLHCWEPYAQTIKEAKLLHPRNCPLSLQFEQTLLGILIVNISNRKCVFTNHLQQPNQNRGMSESFRLDILRTFYIKACREIAPELAIQEIDDSEKLEGLCETYWCSDYHKCHALRSANILCCAVYAPSVPTHTMRLITNQIANEISNSKDVHW